MSSLQGQNDLQFSLVDELGSEAFPSHNGAEGTGGALGVRLRAEAELFDIISNNGEVDHPLCEECTDTIMEIMDQQVVFAKY